MHESSGLVGTWQGDYKDGDHYTMTFNNDGTGVETDRVQVQIILNTLIPVTG